MNTNFNFESCVVFFCVLFSLNNLHTELLADDSFAKKSIAEERPNILWITSEDNGPQLGCYGDKFATTPNIDQLAARSTTYLHAWSNSPVCAPARTTIITGMYANSLGAQHMRSMVPLPVGVKMFPQLLREAGYYCTNNSKEDYNVETPDGVWDESSKTAHYQHRKPGQPFFAVFNIVTTHESQIRKRPHSVVHDPAKVRVPAYHPDCPEVRRDWAQYYDKMTEMDNRVGKILKELDEAGLTNDTIVFYFGDHGPGMPRCKRWPINQGLHVPMIVHIPEKFKSLCSKDYATSGNSKRLISFVDLAPTILSLANIEPPEYQQGKAFLGEYEAVPNNYLFGFRDRMDERYDTVRSVRDERYVLVHNFMPRLPYGQHLHYQRQTPTDRVWKQKFDAGELTQQQAFFWQSKPEWELYDLQNDPDEIHNLFDVENQTQKATELNQALVQWMGGIKDLGLVPESEMHRLGVAVSPFDFARNKHGYDLVSTQDAKRHLDLELDQTNQTNRITSYLGHSTPAIRYWAIQSALTLDDVDQNPELIKRISGLVDDDSYSVEIVAAEFMARHSSELTANESIRRLIALANLNNSSVYTCVEALNAIDRLDERCKPMLEEIKQLPRHHDKVHSRMKDLVQRLLEKTISDIENHEND